MDRLTRMQLKLIDLKKLNAKALLQEAKEEFDKKLPATNGKKWLYFKVAYMWQGRIYGKDLTQKAISNEKRLDDPEYIKELNDKEARYNNMHYDTSLNNTPKQKTNKKSSASPTKKRGTCARLHELHGTGVSKDEAINVLEKEGFTFSKITVNVQWNKASKGL